MSEFNFRMFPESVSMCRNCSRIINLLGMCKPWNAVDEAAMSGTNLGDESSHHTGYHSNVAGIKAMIPIFEMCREHSSVITQQGSGLLDKEREREERKAVSDVYQVSGQARTLRNC